MLPEVLISLTLASPPAILSPVADETICVAVPSAPTRIELTQIDAGDRMWGGDAAYLLSTGDIGAASLVVDFEGYGEAFLAVNDEIIAHVAVHIEAETGRLVTTTWLPEQVEYTPEVIAELLRIDLSGILANSIPQEFKCSRFGRKVLKAGKYMWGGVLAAGGAACCMASATLACPMCAAGVVVGTMAGSDFADGYCD